MIYTAEILKVGDFQAPTKKILVEKIVNYFRENEDETCKIVSIWCDFKKCEYFLIEFRHISEATE